MALGGWVGACSLLLLSCAVGLGLSRVVGAPRMLGAPIEASLDDAETQRALQFAMKLYNLGSNDAYHHRVAEVIRVQKQVVAGIKYIFEVKVGRTSCRNSDAAVEDCAFFTEPGQAKEETCAFEVLVVPWMNEVRLIENNCRA